MTIRKRFDEAQDLISRGLYEPALILLLVATAAAAERLRKHDTQNASKKESGGDRRWFTRYVQAGPLDISVGTPDGQRISVSDALYKDLRCELVHEAQAKEGAFKEEPFIMSINGEGFVFGLGLLQALSKLLISDPLGRDQFRDLLHPFQNLLEFSASGFEEDTRARFIENRKLSARRYEILLNIIAALTPERLAQMDHETMASAFADEFLPHFHAAGLVEGSLTGLRMTHGEPILGSQNELTKAGSDALRELSSFYRTVDLARP